MKKAVILSTRISGVDGVSLEALNWKQILETLGYQVTLVAGKLDGSGIVIQELAFNHPEIVKLYDKVVYPNGDYLRIQSRIFDLAGTIEGRLLEVLNSGNHCDLLVVPNVLSLPMNFPLAVGVARVIEELKIPTIARHHDFWWERERFNNLTMFKFFSRWFPPVLSNLRHVVINSQIAKEFKKKLQFEPFVIPGTFDFKSALNKKDAFALKFREDFEIEGDDLIFLQATRIIPRKRIELSIEFMKKLNSPKAVLVISGRAGDEGLEYFKKNKAFS